MRDAGGAPEGRENDRSAAPTSPMSACSSGPGARTSPGQSRPLGRSATRRLSPGDGAMSVRFIGPL
jgi:hypothetical protein